MFFVVVCRPWYRMSVHNLSALPRSGGMIIAPNHRSYVDTPLVCVALPRDLRFVGLGSIVSHRSVARLYALLGAIPINPETIDRRGIAECIELLKQGHVLVMFPEGKRLSGPSIGTIYSGVAFMAVKAGCPIVPVGIAGAEESMPRGAWFPKSTKVVVQVGDPINVDDSATDQSRRGRTRQSVDALTSTLQANLQAVSDAARKKRSRSRVRIKSDNVEVGSAEGISS